jgi:hypothetical protein
VLCIYSLLAVLLLSSIWSIYTLDSSTAFYTVFVAVALVIGFSVASQRSTSYCEAVFILFAAALILRLIVPLSKPGSIIDNFPDVYDVRRNVLTLINNGHLPTVNDASTTVGFFANYPGINLLFVSLQMVTGIDLNILFKYLPVFLVIPVFGAVPLIVRAMGISDHNAELMATTIVVTIPFLMEGTSHTSPHSFGTIMFILGLAFFLDLSAARKREPAAATCFVLVASSLVIYHVTSSVFLIAIVSLFSLATFMIQFRHRLQVRLEWGLVLLILVIFAAWHAFVSSSSVPELFGVIAQAVFHEISLNVSHVLPAGIKPLWMLIIEYTAFSAFAAAVVIGLLFFTTSRPILLAKLLAILGIFLAELFMVPWFLGLRYASDLFTRSLILFMVASAPLVGVTLGNPHATLRWPGCLTSTRLPLRRLAATALVTVIVLNSVFYAYPVYYYDTALPLQAEDTRHNLEQWQSLGIFASSYLQDNQSLWGPTLGRSFVGDYAGTHYHLFAVETENLIAIKASSFPYLPQLLRGQYVVLSRAMLVAPELPGYVPDIATPAAISTRVYDNGEIIMLLASAPYGLLPEPTPSQ